MNPFVDTPRRRGGLYDDDFLMMGMCESSGIMTATTVFNSTKKACYGPRPGGVMGSWIVFVFLASESKLI